jgi:hypothetical protein
MDHIEKFLENNGWIYYCYGYYFVISCWMLTFYTTCIKQGVVSRVIGEESLAYPTQPILLAMYKYVMCSPPPCHIQY